MASGPSTLKCILIIICIIAIYQIPEKNNVKRREETANVYKQNKTKQENHLKGIECLYKLDKVQQPITWQSTIVKIIYSPSKNCSKKFKDKLKGIDQAVFRVKALSTYEIVTGTTDFVNGTHQVELLLTFPTKYMIVAILTYINGEQLEMRKHVLPILRQVPGSPLSISCHRTKVTIPNVTKYCKANESGVTKGRWVKCGHAITGLEKCGPWQSDKNFNFDRLHNFRWVPYYCQHHQYTNDELKRCFARQEWGSIVFAGDSHMRYRAYHWATRLYGACHACVKTHIKMVFNKVPRIEWIFDARGTRLPLSINNISMPNEKYMHPKVRRSKFSMEYPPEAIGSDLFLVNFGHWVLRESADEKFIKEKLEAFAKGLKDLRSKGKTVVWVNTVSLPWRTDAAVIEWRENTSPSRVRHFNNIADVIMKNFNIPVVDAFQISDGRVTATHDQTHFTKRLPGNDFGGVVENAISNTIANYLCNDVI